MTHIPGHLFVAAVVIIAAGHWAKLIAAKQSLLGCSYKNPVKIMHIYSINQLKRKKQGKK